MSHIQVFDPAPCCSTGVCGTDVDQAMARTIPVVTSCGSGPDCC